MSGSAQGEIAGGTSGGPPTAEAVAAASGAATAAETAATTGDDLLAALVDDFAARARRGERVAAEEYAARHPGLAERIRKLFPAVAAIEAGGLGGNVTMAVTPDDPGGEQPGATVGRYKLIERLGEGGFGVVYLAEQLHPVRRKVALKLVKPGMDSRQVLARFEAERQALAIMDHPNIAKVLDAGATGSGRPYFVMELVRGEPITDFCDAHGLPPQHRLELFVQVCHAVQHAHQKGIIHRDLKPSNVLVAVQDGDAPAVVKVIDFGVAKALGAELTDRTLVTGVAQLVGTPLYMSPEQAGRGPADDVDTRSDVYSLGVLLYELLTGTTPFARERFRRAADDEIRRIIREEEPPRPSTRLGESKDRLASVSAQRHTEPARLAKLVRGELDWIVMKALEKDRGRRYETAVGFARDVERYLNDEPVRACPPSAAYRFGKFARRHRAALAATALMLALLVAGITGTTLGMLRARTAQSRAEALSGFLADAFGAANPAIAGRGRNVKVVEVLDSAADRLSGALAGQPEAEVDARLTIAQTYNALGLYDKAVENYGRAHELARATHGRDDPQTIHAACGLAWAMVERGDYDAAEPLARDTLATAKRALGTADPGTWRASQTYGFALANGWRLYKSKDWRDKFEQAQVVHREVIEWIRRAPADVRDREPALALALHNLATDLQDLGGPERLAEAERVQQEAMAIVRRRPALDATRIQAFYGVTLMLLNRLAEARPVLQEAAAKHRRLLGDTHKTTLMTLAFYSTLLLRLGEYQAAADLHEELLGREREGFRVRPMIPPETMRARLLGRLAAARLGLGQPDAALRAANEAIELATAAADAGALTYKSRGGTELRMAWRVRATAHYRLGDWRAAAEAIRKSMAFTEGGGGGSLHWLIVAMLHWQLGDFDAAAAWHAKAVAGMDPNRSHDAELRELRAEADALILGAPPPPPPPPQRATRSSAMTPPAGSPSNSGTRPAQP